MLEHIDWVNACPYHRDIPAENVANANFIEAATIKPNSPFITRPAPGIGQNLGGGIEVVVPSGGVNMQWFTGMP